jgi:hypothetical protein
MRDETHLTVPIANGVSNTRSDTVTLLTPREE